MNVLLMIFRDTVISFVMGSLTEIQFPRLLYLQYIASLLNQHYHCFNTTSINCPVGPLRVRLQPKLRLTHNLKMRNNRKSESDCLFPNLFQLYSWTKCFIRETNQKKTIIEFQNVNMKVLFVFQFSSTLFGSSCNTSVYCRSKGLLTEIE